MAQVCLDLRQADGQLPWVCMCCGAPASLASLQQFTWTPGWVYALNTFLGFTGAMVVFSKTAYVQIPLCDRHHRYFFHRTWAMLGSLLAVLAYVVLGLLVYYFLLPPQWETTIGIGLFLGGIFLFFLWIAGNIILNSTGIRVNEITLSVIVLKGVCQAFVDAVAAEPERLARRQRKLDNFDEDEERPRPKKKKPTSKQIQPELRLRKKKGPPPLEED